MSPNLMSYKTWTINITLQEIEFEYEASDMIMDQFEGKETNFYLVITPVLYTVGL